ncbi:uncharacterized protein LOC126109547 [Schistocerca cancellata]|uniref:uncharacterized protein LOC126109547 n=1 Tax=Schistocerca cancellata TaxID=274614 RepID=UPI002119B71E|nr:uncharacterized protein LOC126109547 [Schistocerca cancellata]
MRRDHRTTQDATTMGGGKSGNMTATALQPAAPRGHDDSHTSGRQAAAAVRRSLRRPHREVCSRPATGQHRCPHTQATHKPTKPEKGNEKTPTKSEESITIRRRDEMEAMQGYPARTPTNQGKRVHPEEDALAATAPIELPMPTETDAPEAGNALPTAPADRAASPHANEVESSTSEALPRVSDGTRPPTSIDGNSMKRAHAYRVTRESETVLTISHECRASLQQPLETPVDVPTAQKLVPHAAAATLGDDTENEEEEMQAEQTPASSQATSSRASRKRQKSDDDASAPDVRKFRKENAQNSTKTGTEIRRRARDPKVDNDGFETATKTAKATRQSTAAPVGTSNSFQALSDSEDEELTLLPPKQPPPLEIKFVGHFREFQNVLNLLIGKGNYSVNVSGEDLHKVKTTEQYIKVSEECTKRGWNFYTCGANRKKPIEIVFHKILRSMKPEEVKEEVEQMGYCVDERWRKTRHSRPAPVGTTCSSTEFRQETLTHVEPQRPPTARQRGEAAAEAAHPEERIPEWTSTPASSRGTPTPVTKSGSGPTGSRRTLPRQQKEMTGKLRMPPYNRYPCANPLPLQQLTRS